MLQFIMENNLLLYLSGAVCVLGVISQFLLGHLYKRLISETLNTGENSGKFLKQVKMRFQNCTHLNEKVNDISSFTERSMMEYRFLNLNLHQWRKLGLQAMAVCLLLCGTGLMLSVQAGEKITPYHMYIKGAGYAVLLLALAYGITDNRYRYKTLRTRLTDYLQNSGAVRTYSEWDLKSSRDEAAAAESSIGISRSNLRERMIGKDHELEADASRGIRNAVVEIVGEADGAVLPEGQVVRQEEENPKRSVRRGKEENGENRASRERRELKESLVRNKGALSAAETVKEAAAAKGPEAPPLKGSDLLKQMNPQEKEQILKEVLLEILT